MGSASPSWGGSILTTFASPASSYRRRRGLDEISLSPDSAAAGFDLSARGARTGLPSSARVRGRRGPGRDREFPHGRARGRGPARGRGHNCHPTSRSAVAAHSSSILSPAPHLSSGQPVSVLSSSQEDARRREIRLGKRPVDDMPAAVGSYGQFVSSGILVLWIRLYVSPRALLRFQVLLRRLLMLFRPLLERALLILCPYVDSSDEDNRLPGYLRGPELLAATVLSVFGRLWIPLSCLTCLLETTRFPCRPLILLASISRLLRPDLPPLCLRIICQLILQLRCPSLLPFRYSLWLRTSTTCLEFLLPLWFLHAEGG